MIAYIVFGAAMLIGLLPAWWLKKECDKEAAG